VTQRLKRAHGPFRGYRSSVPKQNIDPDEAGPDSRDMLYNPTEGKFVERAGSAILGDTISAGDSAVGLLPTKYSSRARQIVELPNVKDQDGYDQFADGYPTYSTLLTAETAEVAATTPATGKGQDYFRSTNGADSNQVPAKSFSSDTYPATARNGDVSWLKILPFWHATSDPHRCCTAAMRELMVAGSRRALVVGNWKYYPSLYATPSRWNLIYNDNSASPNRIERHAPTGLIPPLFPARFKNSELPTATTTVAAWKAGRSFYVSMCDIFEDGQWGMPYLPRPIPQRPELTTSGTADAGGSTTTMVDAARTEANDTWNGYTITFTSGTLIGQSFVVTDFVAATDTITFAPAASVAPDTMTYELIPYYVNQYGLVTIPKQTSNTDDYYEYLLWAGMPEPPPGCVKKALLRSPSVVYPALPDISDLRIVDVIAAGTTSYKDYKGDDNELLVDDELVHTKHVWPPRARYIGAFDGRACIGYTRRNPAAIIVAPTGATDMNDITTDDHPTMGTIAYTVRVTSTTIVFSKIDGGAGFPQAPAAVSVSTAGGRTIQGVVDAINDELFLTGAADQWRAQLAPGVDGEIVAEGALSLATGHTNAYGDDGLASGGTTGHQQAFSQAWPAVIYLARATVNSLYPVPDKVGFWFTRANPDTLASGVSAAANYWVAENYRQPPEESGILMGFASLVNGMAVFYSKKVWLFRNTRDGRTGSDQDYRFDLLSNDGCIAWDSIVEFNNAVGWLSRKGFKVAGPVDGGMTETLISGAIFDPEDNIGKSAYRIHGNLTYEIEQCIAASAADNDAAEFRARVIGSALYIHYRSSSSVTKPDVMQVYDYSEGVGSGGVRELFRADGSPYGWSPPHRIAGSCIGYYRNATGMVKLHSVDTNAGSTGDGRIDQFDTGYQDNGTAIATVLATKMDDVDEFRRRQRDLKFTAKYKSPTGHALTVTHSRDRARLSATSYTLENTGTAELASQTKRVKLAGQAPARVSEYRFAGTRVTAGPAEIWALEREVKVLDTPLDVAG